MFEQSTLAEIAATIEQISTLIPGQGISIYNFLRQVYPSNVYPTLNVAQALAAIADNFKKLKSCEKRLETIKAAQTDAQTKQENCADAVLLEKTSDALATTLGKAALTYDYLSILKAICDVNIEISQFVSSDDAPFLINILANNLILKIQGIDQVITQKLSTATTLPAHDLEIINTWLDFARGFLMLKHRIALNTCSKNKEESLKYGEYLHKMTALPLHEHICSSTTLYNTICHSVLAQIEDEPLNEAQYLQLLIQAYCNMVNGVEQSQIASSSFIAEFLERSISIINKAKLTIKSPVNLALFLIQTKDGINPEVAPIIKEPLTAVFEQKLKIVDSNGARLARRLLANTKNKELQLQQAVQTQSPAPDDIDISRLAQELSSPLASTSKQKEKGTGKKGKGRKTIPPAPKNKNKKPQPVTSKKEKKQEQEEEAPNRSQKPMPHQEKISAQVQPQSVAAKIPSAANTNDSDQDEFTVVTHKKSQKGKTSGTPIGTEHRQEVATPSSTTTKTLASGSWQAPQAPIKVKVTKRSATAVVLPSQTIALQNLPIDSEIMRNTVAHVQSIMDFTSEIQKSFPEVEINLAGGYARNLFFAHCQLPYKKVKPSDLDIEIVIPSSVDRGALKSLLEKYNFTENPYVQGL